MYFLGVFFIFVIVNNHDYAGLVETETCTFILYSLVILLFYYVTSCIYYHAICYVTVIRLLSILKIQCFFFKCATYIL